MFLCEVAVTNQRPDIVIWFSDVKMQYFLELAVPWEERIEEAFERKRSKYQELADMSRPRVEGVELSG